MPGLSEDTPATPGRPGLSESRPLFPLAWRPGRLFGGPISCIIRRHPSPG